MSGGATPARVLVLGRGVFGGLAARELEARGHVVAAASRATGVDLRDEASLQRALAGADAVLNAAGPFRDQDPTLARAAAAAGVPYADISDDAAFCARVAALPSRAPLMTGMSTTPAVAEALVALLRRRGASGPATCAMYVGGANRQGPATMAFAARSRAEGASLVVDFPGIGRRRAFPARAAVEGASYHVAVGGLPGLGWRFRPLLRLGASIAPRLPRLGRDTAGALLALAGERREGVWAREGGQRLAILPAVWALEEALAWRGPKGAALPRAWVDPEALLSFLAANGFERVSEAGGAYAAAFKSLRGAAEGRR